MCPWVEIWLLTQVTVIPKAIKNSQQRPKSTMVRHNAPLKLLSENLICHFLLNPKFISLVYWVGNAYLINFFIFQCLSPT